MKKFSFKSFFAGFVVCSILMCGSVVFADAAQMTIDVIFGQIKLVVDGKPVEKETLLYNGTTYVPLRAAAEALGKEVGYDDSIKTAYIGQIPDSVNNGGAAPAPVPAASSQVELEKDYLKFMIDIYYDMLESAAKVEAEAAELEDNPLLIMDASWKEGFTATIGDFTAKMQKLSSYDKAKVPEIYLEFHNSFIAGCDSFQKGMDRFFYGLENLDMEALSEAETLINEAMEHFEKASSLEPEFNY